LFLIQFCYFFYYQDFGNNKNQKMMQEYWEKEQTGTVAFL